MDDRFLHEARRAPRPEFATSLRRRLAANDAARHARSLAARRTLRRAFTVALPIAAAIVALAAFPEVRAGAQAFLELFRVRNFVAVRVDPARLEALEKNLPEPGAMFGAVRVLRPAAPPQTYDSPALAFAAAGFAGAEPAFRPNGVVADSVTLRDGQEVDVTLDARRLRDLLASLGIADVGIPAAFDGAHVRVSTGRTVAIRYRKDGQQAVLLQGPNPELSLPPGLERARLAEIALRVIGLSADEARRFADRVDWNTTMLVPLSSGRATFSEVDVHGGRGLLIERTGDPPPASPGEKPRPRTVERVLLWSNGERVFALAGNVPDHALLQMANSIPEG